jgi:hypothetical protein
MRIRTRPISITNVTSTCLQSIVGLLGGCACSAIAKVSHLWPPKIWTRHVARSSVPAQIMSLHHESLISIAHLAAVAAEGAAVVLAWTHCSCGISEPFEASQPRVPLASSKLFCS